MTDEDFAAAEGENARTIEIEDFVPYEEIDPIYFERSFLLGPEDGGEKVYALLVRAMEDSGLVAVGRYVMRDKQHLGCLRVREGVITLERMYFADEVRPVDELKPKRVSVGKRELEMARAGRRFAGSFEPEKYEDTHRKALLKVIRDKQKGKEIHAPPQPGGSARSDGCPPGEPRGRAEGPPARRLAWPGRRRPRELSKDELGELAKRAKIVGRSKMSKDELIEALEAA